MFVISKADNAVQLEKKSLRKNKITQRKSNTRAHFTITSQPTEKRCQFTSYRRSGEESDLNSQGQRFDSLPLQIFQVPVYTCAQASTPGGRHPLGSDNHGGEMTLAPSVLLNVLRAAQAS